MSWYSSDWAPYVPVAQRKRNAEREVKRLQNSGHAISPIRVVGRAITTTIWGKAWCDNLESYHDYAHRLERGRSYVRHGAVIDLKIEPSLIEARVSGSSVYRVSVAITKLADAQWHAIRKDCTGRIESLIDLLQGRLSAAVMERLSRQGQGLFPRPSEIRFRCSCPDHAMLCKHVAAVLYGVGVRLDSQPELLFLLRDVDETALLSNAAVTLPDSGEQAPAGRRLEDENVSTIFGLEMADLPANASATTAKRPTAISVSTKPARRSDEARRAKSSRIKVPKLKAGDEGKTKGQAEIAAKAKPLPKSRVARHSPVTRASPTTMSVPKPPKSRADGPADDKPVKWWLKTKKPVGAAIIKRKPK